MKNRDERLGASLRRMGQLTSSLETIIQTCCTSSHRSSLLDSLIPNLKYHIELDYKAHPELAGMFPDDEKTRPVLLKGTYVLQQAQHISDFMRWFAIGDERKKLSVMYSVMMRLIGHSADHPDIRDRVKTMAHGGHSSCFCAYSMELLQLLQRAPVGNLRWEMFADAILALAPDPPAGITGRSARRNPMVQKEARRCLQLCARVAGRFPAADLCSLCARRERHYGALVQLVTKMISTLRAAPETVWPDGAGPGARGALAMSIDRLSAIGDAFGAWGAEELLAWDAHCLGLARLAGEISAPMKSAFGDHFQDIAWTSDVYEYMPKEEMRADLLNLIEENELLLRKCAASLDHVVKSGAVELAAGDDQPGAATSAATNARAQRHQDGELGPLPAAKSKSNKKKNKKK